MAKKINESDRHIATYFFTDATKNYITRTIWSKYPRSAVQRAVDRLTVNDLGAMVAVIYDDFYGQDHAIVTRDIDGNVAVQYRRNPNRAAIAGTSQDPFGEFVKKTPKTRKVLKFKETPADVIRKLRIKLVKPEAA